MKKIRIRHRGDRHMFFGEVGWTLNPDKARVFSTSLEAIAFIIQRQIGNAELVVEGAASDFAEVAAAV